MNILNKLTIKHLKMNKRRTIVTIVGVMLSCALMIGIGLLASTLRDYMIKEIISSNGSSHLTIENVDASKMNIVMNNQNIKDYKILSEIGYSYVPDNKDSEIYSYYYIGAANDSLLEDLPLEEGRLPKNSYEVIISSDIISELGKDYQIGDEITLDVGNRYLDDSLISDHNSYYTNETTTEELKDLGTKTYKIVGIVSTSHYNNFSYFSYMIYTKYESSMDNNFTVYITLKNPKNGYEIGDEIAAQLGFGDQDKYYSNVSYNDSLLSMSGASKYDNITSAMSSIIAIVLALVSVACIIVIYNSFAISVMERKKQFGLFSSIGATKKQLRKTVFFEALIIGIIGIPLGIAAGFIGIWVVLQIINNLLADVFTLGGFSLAVYPIFIIIPIIFMIGVILVSAFLPARKASKITPIEAIRLNDDIKIKSKKIKTSKLVTKLFGVEGEIALKNMKRNKSKYRITIVSLFISIVLFVSFSSLLQYGLIGTTDALGDIDYDVEVSSSSHDNSIDEELFSALKATKGVKNSVMFKYNYLYYETDTNVFSDNYIKLFGLEEASTYGSDIRLVVLDKNSYNKLKDSLNLTEDKPIIINQFYNTSYNNSNRKTTIGKIFKEDDNLELNIQHLSYMYQYDESEINVNEETNVDTFTMTDFVFSDQVPFGLKTYTMGSSPIIVVTEEYLDSIILEEEANSISGTEMMFETDDTNAIAEKYDSLDDSLTDNTYYYDIAEQMSLVRNLIFVIKLLLYGFITLVTLIGVTSVFNTINTSIALRRKEFSVLRSIGLTPKGFNKMLRFETLMFGVKSLFYAIPVSLAITYLIFKSVSDVTSISFMIPWESIIFAVLGVFIIVSIAMTYATNKIKHENILNAIRDENI
ncbi:MAG: FtsX-like permease family protein [Bacilli bacterium]|nr:FtsX-like permease family protein [Bacilli bacterium]